MALRLPDEPIILPRARLRLWSNRDLVALVAAWQDPEMHRWMPEAPKPFAQVRRHDDGPLEEDTRALETGAPWPA